MDANPGPLGAEDSTIFSVGDCSKKVEIFLEEPGGEIHPIFDMEDKDSQQPSTAPTQNAFDRSTHLHAEQFLKVMEEYQASMKDPSISALDLRGKHSWDDVLQAAKKAEAEYLEAGRKGLRKAGRFITAKSEAMLPYLQLIPNGFFTSILCGGLKLVFGAASRIGEKRGKVLKALLRIPDVIAQAEDCVEAFPSDPALYDKAAELYLAALTAIEGTTKWLTKNPAWEQVRALALGPLYLKSFEEKIQALERALSALQGRVSTLRDGAIVKTEKVVERMDSTTEATLHRVHSLHSEVKDLNLSADRTGLKVSSIAEGMETLTKSQDETHVKIDHLHDLQQTKEEVKRAMAMVLEQTTKTSEWMRQKDRVIRRLKRQIEMLQKAATSLSQGDLLDILDVSADSPIQDLRRIIRAGQSTELSASHTAKGIIEGKKLQDWLSTDASAALFIEGSSPLASCGRNKPMSLMSSVVIESLHDKEPAIAIYFFCGSHTSSKDSIKGPHGMMRSLICQILRLFVVDLDFISSRRYREQLQSFNFRTLCDCFGKLVKKLPIDTVLFCIIDSICFFEKKEWAEDCRKVANDLQDLADDDEPGAVFKLLITSPSRSRYVGGTFPSQCRLLLPADGLSGRDGPTERQISMGARRPAKVKESDIFRLLRAKSCLGNGGEESSDFLSESDALSDSDEE